ncbi:unnamed protein product [Prorocentrum cordatum]|uniref:Uncharacterized protein n=1 Tax=Prorocentrum cordatum TaxID=2364126 RepID=A0ABN9QFP4_9DINO|nr:unnamed protein product [Polarella glacialis]
MMEDDDEATMREKFRRLGEFIERGGMSIREISAEASDLDARLQEVSGELVDEIRPDVAADAQRMAAKPGSIAKEWGHPRAHRHDRGAECGGSAAGRAGRAARGAVRAAAAAERDNGSKSRHGTKGLGEDAAPDPKAKVIPVQLVINGARPPRRATSPRASRPRCSRWRPRARCRRGTTSTRSCRCSLATRYSRRTQPSCPASWPSGSGPGGRSESSSRPRASSGCTRSAPRPARTTSSPRSGGAPSAASLWRRAWRAWRRALGTGGGARRRTSPRPPPWRGSGAAASRSWRWRRGCTRTTPRRIDQEYEFWRHEDGGLDAGKTLASTFAAVQRAAADLKAAVEELGDASEESGQLLQEFEALAAAAKLALLRVDEPVPTADPDAAEPPPPAAPPEEPRSPGKSATPASPVRQPSRDLDKSGVLQETRCAGDPPDDADRSPSSRLKLRSKHAEEKLSLTVEEVRFREELRADELPREPPPQEVAATAEAVTPTEAHLAEVARLEDAWRGSGPRTRSPGRTSRG